MPTNIARLLSLFLLITASSYGQEQLLFKDDPFLACIDSSLFCRWQSAYSVEERSLEKVKTTESKEVYQRRFKQLRTSSPFPFAFTSDVKYQIEKVLKRAPRQFAILQARADLYFPIFEERLDHYGLPLELKYLAVIESALNPKIRSRAGAVGLWPFMYGTAKVYDLKVSNYVDERMDPYMSTDAACRHLKDLYETFGDWNLVLAAYNAGPGRVRKAIRYSGGKVLFHEIERFLPSETRNYVPKFNAMAYLFTFADKHRATKAKPNYNYYQLDTIQVNDYLRLDVLSEILSLDLDQVQDLNPAYKYNIIPAVENRPYALVLAREEMGRYLLYEDSIRASMKKIESERELKLPKYIEQPDRIVYRVKSGDYLGRIATRYGVSVSQIKRWNRLSSDRLRIGQRLIIYPSPSKL